MDFLINQFQLEFLWILILLWYIAYVYVFMWTFKLQNAIVYVCITFKV